MKLPPRCVDLTSEQVVLALGSRVIMHELLGHLASIAKPATGAPKILVPIARMASTECAWIDGKITVKIEGNDYTTSIKIEVDGGKGSKALFPRLLLRVPFEEFTKAVKLAPKIIFPLKVRMAKSGIVLSCDADVVGTLPPTPFAKAEAAIKKTLPPAVRKSLLPRDTDPVRMSFDVPEVGEAELLAQFPPSAGRTPKLAPEDELDSGWDDAPASTKPKATSKKPSKAPARATKKPSRSPSPVAKQPSKKPPPRPLAKGRGQ